MSYRLRALFAFIFLCLLAATACNCGGGGSGSSCHGAKGCACYADGNCSSGLSCSHDTCVDLGEDNGSRPTSPVCYTPCKTGVTDGKGNYTPCSADGLLRGCLDSAQCVDGTCQAPKSTKLATPPAVPACDAGYCEDGGDAGVLTHEGTPGACQKNVDCPDFQVCIESRCYSNCETDSDCTSPKACYRKSCRIPCSSANNTCPAGTFCSVVDSQSGFCLPLQEPADDGGAKTSVSGTFALSSSALKFTNISIDQSIMLTNNSPQSIEFTVTKLSHTEHGTDGAKVITSNPLPWMTMGEKGSAAKVNLFKVRVDSGASAEIEFDNDDPAMPAKWEGSLQVQSSELGAQTVSLSYAAGADGRWSGKVYYFAQFGDSNLDAWIAKRGDDSALSKVGNAFVQRWGALRGGRITLDEFNAVVTATTTESWLWPSIQSVCPTDACYPYSNTDGFSRYSDSLTDQPVPRGVAELPIALDLKTIDATHLKGRIASEESLQYAGNPDVSLTFSTDPSQCANNNSSACLALVDSLDASIVVGGRYSTTVDDVQCALGGKGFQQAAIPWVVPGFTSNATQDPSTNAWHVYECRDSLQPSGASDPQNVSLAQSNPIPDGASRRRRLELVDGALVNQQFLYLIVRERFEDSFLGASTGAFAAYSLVVLQRSNAQLDASAFDGTAQMETRTSSVDLGAAVQCPAELLGKFLPAKQGLTAQNADSIAQTLLSGVVPASTAAKPLLDTVHWLCNATIGSSHSSTFDAGGNPNAPAPCPAGSQVTYFYGKVPDDLSSEPCQSDGTCQATLNNWVQDSTKAIVENPVWQCTDSYETYCDSDRVHLTAGKVFYAPQSPEVPFLPLPAAIDQAFRYKTQFEGRQGTSVGFAPNICVPDSDSVPYCYDPTEIAEAQQRTNCLLSIYASATAPKPTLNLTPATQSQVKTYLQTSFSYLQQTLPGQVTPVIHDGFERLNAELLVMLGDDAYTKAFQSRFDLADANLVSFEGSKFEPRGIDLSGVAGYEMYTLYQAAQYYQMVLDRFYSLSPYIWQAVKNSTSNYITQETVTSYLDHVMRASTQKSRSWSEIGKRYESFNHPELARFAVQRAYTSAYLESIILSSMMQSVVSVVTPEERDQIRTTIANEAVTYKAALLDMRDVYATLTDQLNDFGYPPEYIPFPALDATGPTAFANAFEAQMAAANAAAQTASTKEDLAIASSHSFDSDAESFQAELASITNTYDNQLSDICGTFTGDDTLVYPAVPKYAYLNARARLLGNPCGLMGNGSLFDAMAGVDQARLGVQVQQAAFNSTMVDVNTEKAKYDALCGPMGVTTSYFNAKCQIASTVTSLGEQITDAQNSITTAQLLLQGVNATANVLSSCIPSTSVSATGPSTSFSPGACAGSVLTLGASVGAIGTQASAQDQITSLKQQIDDTQNAGCQLDSTHECGVAQADENANVLRFTSQFETIELETLRAVYQVQTSLADVDKLRNQASRLLAEQAQSQQLAINVEAAKDDPDVRIYKNDAILNADATFQSALQEAYKATKVFEYYTSQSYADLVKLPLVRLVSRGDYSLQTYLADLADAYSTFSETFGTPDSRVDILSLRDDILQIPRIGGDGNTLSESDRVAAFRQALQDPKLIDAKGYLTIPFSTSLARLSPATRNHKLVHIEAEVVGSNVGDGLGRIYLTQDGTGVVDAVGDDKQYFRFPARTAVINTFFNGVRSLDPTVYQNFHLRDRPYVNTHWDFVLNQRDELVNQDIDVKSLTDVRLYVYYTDFTGQ